PYYTKAEWLYQVHGEHGTDPTEGAWSKQYPWPPVSHEPRLQEITDALVTGGGHPVPPPRRPLPPGKNRPPPHRLPSPSGDGYPCLVHAKSDAETIAVRPIIDQPNVTLLVDAEVTKLETDAGGRTVTRVVVNRNGTVEHYEAGIVAIAAGAANTAKILLASA